MARKRTKGFTEREAQILSVLWELGEGNVEDVRKRLPGNPAASTVRTLLSLMIGRGFVADDGRRYAKKYHACIDRKEGQHSVLRRVIDTLFSGSTEAMLLRLMDDEEVDLERLKQLQARIAEDRAAEE